MWFGIFFNQTIWRHVVGIYLPKYMASCGLVFIYQKYINPLNAELNPICYLLALLAHHFLHVRRIRVKSLTLRLLMSYIYIYIYIWSTYS